MNEQDKGLTPEALHDRIAHTEIVKHITPTGKVLRWAVHTMENGFAITGEPSAAVSVANDNAEIGERIAIENATNSVWAFEGYLLAEHISDTTIRGEQGKGFPCRYSVGEKERKKVMVAAIEDARRTLPKGAVFEIRAKAYPDGPRENQDGGKEQWSDEELDNDWAMAWIWLPKQTEACSSYEIPQSPLFELDTDKGEFHRASGYVILARVKA